MLTETCVNSMVHPVESTISIQFKTPTDDLLHFDDADAALGLSGFGRIWNMSSTNFATYHVRTNVDHPWNVVLIRYIS